MGTWARVHLAGNWSGIVTLKKDHVLIRTGPNARIRHPIYTGFQVALTGTALVIGQWRAMVALAIVLAAHLFKARKRRGSPANSARHLASTAPTQEGFCRTVMTATQLAAARHQLGA
ncbi:MAG: isoprenylcysteine carboxylmethyltransferase family protein [Candidatus Acidiferrales bacterium]